MLLFVLLRDIDGLCVVGHGHVFHLGGISRHFHSLKEFFDEGLGVVYVNVTHDDDTLVVWAVPFFVIGLQGGRVAAVHYAHQTDRHAVAVFGAGEKLRQGTLLHTGGGGGAQTVFVVYHIAFFFYLFLAHLDTTRPVFQHEQARVKGRLALCRHVGDVIDGAVDRGVGIQAASIFYADRLQVFSQRASGEVLRTVEGHVL